MTDRRHSFVMPLTCAPARLPADTTSKHLVDRLQPTGASQWLFFAVVGALVIAAPLLPTRPGLAVGALASFAGSAWCLANFWRCREAHCIVTGGGWAALFVLQIIELAIGRSLIHGTESSSSSPSLSSGWCSSAAGRWHSGRTRCGATRREHATGDE